VASTDIPTNTPTSPIIADPISYEFSLTDIIDCGLGVVRSKEVPAVDGKQAATVKECYEKYR